MTLSLTEEGAVATWPRPRGSKKKPNVPSTGITVISDKMKTHVLEVSSGFDVIDTLEGLFQASKCR